MGPATSTVGDIAVFGNNTGNIINDSGFQITDLLQRANNLSDLSNVVTARSNLGLTNVATSTTIDHAVLVGDATGGINNVGPGLTNQVLLGNTSLDPSFGTVPNAALTNSSITLVAGSNITLTPLSGIVALGGSITISASGVSFPLLAPDGTAANPSYSFINAASNGFFNDGGSTGVSWNGSTSFRFGFTNTSINIFEIGSGFSYSYLDPGATPFTSPGNNVYYSVNCSGGAYAFNLPNSARTGQIFIIKDRTGSSATHNITVSTPGGTVTIDGATSLVMNNNFQSLGVIFNGSNYEILG